MLAGGAGFCMHLTFLTGASWLATACLGIGPLWISFLTLNWRFLEVGDYRCTSQLHTARALRDDAKWMHLRNRPSLPPQLWSPTLSLSGPHLTTVAPVSVIFLHGQLENLTGEFPSLFSEGNQKKQKQSMWFFVPCQHLADRRPQPQQCVQTCAGSCRANDLLMRLLFCAYPQGSSEASHRAQTGTAPSSNWLCMIRIIFW